MNPNMSHPQSSDAMRRQRSSSRLNPADVLVFLIPCLRVVQVKLVGVLSGSDLLFLAVFIFLAIRGQIRIRSSVGKKCMFLCSLWLASQCITDAVRHSAFADYARGWSNIGLTLVNVAVMYTLLYDRPRRLVLYGWGLVVGSLLTLLFNPDLYMKEDPWKFGIAFPLSLAVMLLASRKEWLPRLSIVLTASVGVINIVMGARSMGGLCLGAALYLLITRAMARKGAGDSRAKARSVVTVAALLVLGAAGILWGYQYAATRGLLGEEARTKYEHQSSGQYGLLLGGRVEALSSLPAIYDSPILGHGSWARDPSYLLAEREALAVMGYIAPSSIINNEFEEGLIPSHSFLFGAWVNAGILGGVFWGWVWLLALKTLTRVYPIKFVLLPVMSFAGFALLWDILFSPYGAEMRIISPYFIVMMMTCLSVASHHALPAANRTVRKPIVVAPMVRS
jgi:hypothetical protein